MRRGTLILWWFLLVGLIPQTNADQTLQSCPIRVDSTANHAFLTSTYPASTGETVYLYAGVADTNAPLYFPQGVQYTLWYGTIPLTLSGGSTSTLKGWMITQGIPTLSSGFTRVYQPDKLTGQLLAYVALDPQQTSQSNQVAYDPTAVLGYGATTKTVNGKTVNVLDSYWHVINSITKGVAAYVVDTTFKPFCTEQCSTYFPSAIVPNPVCPWGTLFSSVRYCYSTKSCYAIDTTTGLGYSCCVPDAKCYQVGSNIDCTQLPLPNVDTVAIEMPNRTCDATAPGDDPTNVGICSVPMCCLPVCQYGLQVSGDIQAINGIYNSIGQVHYEPAYSKSATGPVIFWNYQTYQWAIAPDKHSAATNFFASYTDTNPQDKAPQQQLSSVTPDTLSGQWSDPSIMTKCILQCADEYTAGVISAATCPFEPNHLVLDTSKTCTSDCTDSRNQCCSPAPSCATVEKELFNNCSAGNVFNASEWCTDINCANALADCCVTAPLCSSQYSQAQCGDVAVSVFNPSASCKIITCNSTDCCTSPDTCGSVQGKTTCPSPLVFNPATKCKTHLCTNAKKDCCEKAWNCSTLTTSTCAQQGNNIVLYSKQLCGEIPCTATDCCHLAPNCSTVEPTTTCPAHQVFQPINNYCTTWDCTQAVADCCIKAPICTSFTGTCSNTTVYNKTVECTTPVCQASDCCPPAPLCESQITQATCVALTTGNNAPQVLWPLDTCSTVSCQDSECCHDAPVCSDQLTSAVCTKGKTFINSKYCSTSTCTETDCCVSICTVRIKGATTQPNAKIVNDIYQFNGVESDHHPVYQIVSGNAVFLFFAGGVWNVGPGYTNANAAIFGYTTLDVYTPDQATSGWNLAAPDSMVSQPNMLGQCTDLCSTLNVQTCPAKDVFVGTNYCDGSPCVAQETDCCPPAGVCSAFTASTYAGPCVFPLVFNATILCAKTTCGSQECCSPAPACPADYQCPGGEVLNPNLFCSTYDCSSATTDCCVPQRNCSTYSAAHTCPTGYTFIEEAMCAAYYCTANAPAANDCCFNVCPTRITGMPDFQYNDRQFTTDDLLNTVYIFTGMQQQGRPIYQGQARIEDEQLIYLFYNSETWNLGPDYNSPSIYAYITSTALVATEIQQYATDNWQLWEATDFFTVSPVVLQCVEACTSVTPTPTCTSGTIFNEQKYCATSACQPNECCDPVGMCSRWIDPFTQVGTLACRNLRPQTFDKRMDADHSIVNPNLSCAGLKCTVAECCQEAPQCDSSSSVLKRDTYSCPPGYAFAGKKYCKTWQCANETPDFCCTQVDSCSNYNAQSMACPPGNLLDTTLPCIGHQCTLFECCRAAPMCPSTTPCTTLPHTTPAVNRYCTTSDCSGDNCCVSVARCYSYDKTQCYNQGLAYGGTMLYCDNGGLTCNSKDCCVARATCSDAASTAAIKCGPGRIYDTTVICREAVCEPVECCAIAPTCGSAGKTCTSPALVATNRVCKSLGCANDDCCVSAPTCASFDRTQCTALSQGFVGTKQVCKSLRCTTTDCCK